MSKRTWIRCAPVTDGNPFAEIHPRKSEDFREWISALAYECFCWETFFFHLLLNYIIFIISMFLYHAYHGSCRCNVPGDTMRAWMCASNAHYNLLRCTCHWNYIWWKYQLRHECSMQQINIENIQHVGKWIFRKMAKSTLAFYKRCRMDLLKSRTKLCSFQTLLRY